MANLDAAATLKNVSAHCKEYGFIYPSSEIYDGLSAAYDYGPYGADLKNNIKNYWWQAMTRLHRNIVGIDSSIFMHPTTWKASGHVDAFNDPLIDNKDSKKRYRADVLLEDQIAKIQGKIDKEVTKAAKRFGDDFDEAQFLDTNGRVKGYQKQIGNIENTLKTALESGELSKIKDLIEELGIADPVSGSKNWTDVRQFNLMFSTELGSVAGEAGKIYLRPELVYTRTKSTYSVDGNNNDYNISKLDLPVLLGYKIIGPLHVFAGPAFQYTLSNDLDGLNVEDVENDFTVGLNIGAGVNLGKLGLDVRYERGFSENEAEFIGNNVTDISGRVDSRPSQVIFSLSLKL